MLYSLIRGLSSLLVTETASVKNVQIQIQIQNTKICDDLWMIGTHGSNFIASFFKLASMHFGWILRIWKVCNFAWQLKWKLRESFCCRFLPNIQVIFDSPLNCSLLADCIPLPRGITVCCHSTLMPYSYRRNMIGSFSLVRLKIILA
jgi:hypothetical protein